MGILKKLRGKVKMPKMSSEEKMSRFRSRITSRHPMSEHGLDERSMNKLERASERRQTSMRAWASKKLFEAPERMRERAYGHFLGSGSRSAEERKAFLKARRKGRMAMLEYSGRFKGGRSVLGRRARNMPMPKPRFSRGAEPKLIQEKYGMRKMYLQAQQQQYPQRPMMQRPAFYPQQRPQQYPQQAIRPPTEQGWFDFSPPTVNLKKNKRDAEDDTLTLW